MKRRQVCSLEADYGNFYGAHLVRWNWWRDKAFSRLSNFGEVEAKFDLEVNFEQMPKLKRLAEILEAAEREFKATDLYRDLYLPSKSSKKKRASCEEKEEDSQEKQFRTDLHKNLLVPVKNYRQQSDVMKFLHYYFVKKD